MPLPCAGTYCHCQQTQSHQCSRECLSLAACVKYEAVPSIQGQDLDCKAETKEKDFDLNDQDQGLTSLLNYSTHLQFYLHTARFIRKRNEPYLHLPSQPQLVLIYRPRRDERLSGPWCEVAQAEIRTCNLPIANPALYHTATSGPTASRRCVVV